MSRRNTYTRTSQILHMVIATIVIFMLCVSFFMGDAPDQYKGVVYTLHKSFGLTILALMVYRILWISLKGRPSLPKDTPRWEFFLSRSVQYGLYILLIIMPLSGWLMSVAANKSPSYFWLFTAKLPIEPNKALASFMNESHEWLAWVIIVFVALHVAGAMKHLFINKDNVVQKMFLKKD